MSFFRIPKKSTTIAIVKTMSTNKMRSTTGSGSQVYESKRAVAEYLLFHYGIAKKILIEHNNSPSHALNFTEHTASICSEFSIIDESSRALDVGCAVGGTSFQLAKYFNDVVGIDYSKHFVDAAVQMKELGVMELEILKQGQIFQKSNVEVESSIDRSRVTFLQGDACNLNPSIGFYFALFTLVLSLVFI